MMENNKRVFLLVVIGVLLIASVFFGLKYSEASSELAELKSKESKVEMNAEVIDFTTMFIEEVLQADSEVDFETRLSLENAVRGLEDEEIMAEWQKFVGSKTEAEAQESVKRLLGMLMSKIQK
jgi:hypothetical protein